MAKTLSIGAATKQIRAAMLGAPDNGMQIHRQAWRVSDGDSDELVLLTMRDGSWWVARRLSDRLSVWAYAGEDEAWDGFDRLAAEGATWHEATATQLAS
ncbi:hypothetical protein [uncultured Jatrophihabitans sp.]|uniref:hypothetical protein n=1 Tax=uncultured Jatrophihabitans sp. TaxID=1610747 RepID=UPI0035C9E0FF